jgi:hypothetical protein
MFENTGIKKIKIRLVIFHKIYYYGAAPSKPKSIAFLSALGLAELFW